MKKKNLSLSFSKRLFRDRTSITHFNEGNLKLWFVLECFQVLLIKENTRPNERSDVLSFFFFVLNWWQFEGKKSVTVSLSGTFKRNLVKELNRNEELLLKRVFLVTASSDWAPRNQVVKSSRQLFSPLSLCYRQRGVGIAVYKVNFVEI